MNPYDILGVSQSATDDEVKRAYRTLSKKYHPDANVNNPNKDLYTEKFKQVQNAYDQIMDMRKRGTTYDQYQSQQAYSNPYQSYQQGNTQYREYHSFEEMFNDFMNGGFQQSQGYQNPENQEYQSVLTYLQHGYYNEAKNVLSGITNHDGKWYYYSAICESGLGNRAMALQYAQTACELDPTNQNYRMFYQQLHSGRTQYRQRRSSYSSPLGQYAECCYRLMIWNLVLSCCCGRGCC